jgi:acyl carrier protein
MEKLLEIINYVLINNELNVINKIDEKLRFKEDLELDSIMLAELTVRIEDEFNIDIFENGMVFTIGDVTALLKL